MNWRVANASGSISAVFATKPEADQFALDYEATYNAQTCVRANFGWQITQTNDPVTPPDELPPWPGERPAIPRMTREEARSAITDLLGGP